MNPVLLIPGLWDTVAVFDRLVPYLEDLGFPVYPFCPTPNDGTMGLERLAYQVRDYVDQTFGPEQPLDCIGFSMGGLVGRYYVQRLGGALRVRRFVTLGTPHGGTWLAYCFRRPGIRQMRPHSEFLQDLQRDTDTLRSVQFISLWTPLDLVILPAASSKIRVGLAESLWMPHHRSLVTGLRSLRRIAQLLRLPEQ